MSDFVPSPIPAPTPAASPAPASPVASPAVRDIVFPVPLARFLPTLRKTHDEVWSRLLKTAHGNEKHTPAEWQALISKYKGA
jgi:hypothetical protein